MLSRINNLFITIISTIFVGRLTSVIFGFDINYTIILLVSGLIILSVYWLLRPDGWKYNSTDIIVLLVISFFSLGNYVYHDYSFAGNDNTGMAVMAIYYSDTNSIFVNDMYAEGYSAFGSVRDEGILPQFLPGYPAYLSFFYSYLGVEGFFIGNAILFFSILLSLFIILGNVIKDPVLQLFGVIFIGTNFLYIYFFQKTFSEILLMRGYLSSVYCMILYTKKYNIFYMITGGLIAGLLLFIKLEVLIFLMPLLFGFCYFWKSKKNPNFHLVLNVVSFGIGIAIFYFFVVRYQHHYVLNHIEPIYRYAGGKGSFYISIFTIALLILTTNVNRYISILKRMHVFISSMVRKNRLIGMFVIILLGLLLLTSGGSGYMPFKEYVTIYILQMFQNYNLWIFMLLSPLIFYRNLSKNDIVMLLLFVLALIFLINPGIGWRQPWAMRKFIVWMIPLFLIIYLIGLRGVKKSIQYIISSIIILLNIIYASQIMFTNEGYQAYASMQSFAEEYQGEYFVMENGWGWQKRIGYYLNFFTDNHIIRSNQLEKVDPNNIYDWKYIYVDDKNNDGDFIFYEDHLAIPCDISGLVDSKVKSLPTQRIEDLCRNLSYSAHKIDTKKTFLNILHK